MRPCLLCKHEHSPLMHCSVARRIREAAINREAKAFIAPEPLAINEPEKGRGLLPEKPAAINEKVVALFPKVSRRTQNRRGRDDYNAYMREYMRKRRAS